jgi:predicted nuclease with TOPRIM domain
VERLLNELLLATEAVTSLEAEVKDLRKENKVLNSEVFNLSSFCITSSLLFQCEYLAHDKNRVVTELNEIHQKMVAQSVQAQARERQCELTLEKMSDQVKDTRFQNSQLTKRLHDREDEIAQLRKDFDEMVARSLVSVQTSLRPSLPCFSLHVFLQKEEGRFH